MIIESYTFTSAELAVLTHYMAGNVLPVDEAARGVDAEQLTSAEEDLRERGLLIRAPGEDITVAGELAALLMITMVPDQVAILRTILPDGPQPQMHFSFAAEAIVCNFVNTQGVHVFSAFRSLDEALNALIAASGVPERFAVSVRRESQALDRLIASMEALTMLMIVEQPRQLSPKVQTLSWLVSHGSLWLVDTDQAEHQSAQCVDQSVLEHVLVQALRIDPPAGS